MPRPARIRGKIRASHHTAVAHRDRRNADAGLGRGERRIGGGSARADRQHIANTLSCGCGHAGDRSLGGKGARAVV
jgi:hypothetical protein